MRILHVTKKYPDAIGGDSTCVFNIEREQVKMGHEVFILTTNCREIIDKSRTFLWGEILNPVGKVSLISIHPSSSLRGIMGRCGIKKTCPNLA